MNPNFGYKHLTGLAWLFTLIAIALTVLLILKRKYKLDEKYDRAVIRYTCYFMWVWEIIKTVRMINYADFGPVGHYPVWMAPFHICSTGLYVYLIVGSKRQSKISAWVTPYAYAVLMVVTSIILTIPASSSILGMTPNWKFVFDNILPYQSFLYHGSLLFVSLYMALSGFYRPRFSDIYRAVAVAAVLAVCAQTLNYVFDGSGADFMTLRYGNGNPFAFLIAKSHVLYYIVLVGITSTATALVISATIGIRALAAKLKCLKNKEVSN